MREFIRRLFARDTENYQDFVTYADPYQFAASARLNRYVDMYGQQGIEKLYPKR